MDYYHTQHGTQNMEHAEIKKKQEENFRKQMLETEGLELKTLRYFSGANPLRPTLFAGKHIVAGNLGGMIEPVFTFGIVGALHSGKIAALAIMDREKAIRDFKEFTRVHKVLHKIPPVIRKTPWFMRKSLMSMMLDNPDRYKVATEYILKGIPGYKGPNFIKKKS